MTKAHKLVKRVQRLEDRHRRDMVRIKIELLKAVNDLLDARAKEWAESFSHSEPYSAFGTAALSHGRTVTSGSAESILAQHEP